MDKEVLKKRLMVSCEAHLDQAMAAVEAGPGGAVDSGQRVGGAGGLPGFNARMF